MPDSTWVPGLVVLAAGAVGGLVLAVRARRSAPAPGRVDATGTDLERQRDALYQQIRDLDAGRAATSPDDYRAERLRLVIDAARTLRAMEAPEVVPTPAVPRAPSWGDRHPTLVGVLWGAGVVGFGGALYIGLTEYVKPKEEMAAPAARPSDAQMEAMRQQRVDQMVAEAKKAYDAAPDDLAAGNAYAHVLLQAGEVMPAFEVTKKITEAHPDDPEARTHQAIVLMEIGDMDMASQLLDKVLAANPGFAEALGYRGALAYNSGAFAEAASMWERAKVAEPAMASMLDPLILQAKAGGKAPPGMAGPAASGPASGGASAGPTPSDVTGSVALTGGLSAPGQAMVFIYARPTGVDAGPPAAVLRIPAAAFPLDFRIGPNDSPMGGPFPEEMTLTARVDHDGNPTTKEPEDLEGRAEHVKPGQTGVAITLALRGP
jgi:cytochrome c-type biogenesis protein CcmH/NrfG